MISGNALSCLLFTALFMLGGTNSRGAQEALKRLEGIVHPLVADERRRFLAQVRKRWACKAQGAVMSGR